MELALQKSAMNEFQDILSERRKTNDILWAARKWDPVCVYAQTKRSNPNDIKNKTLVAPPLKYFLYKLSKSKNVPMKTLNKTASAVLEDIAFKRATSLLRILAWITSKLTKSLLYGVMVNTNKFLMIKSEFGKNPVLLVPNHRSYGDFILMSFICFHFDVDIPRIAAGNGFLKMALKPYFTAVVPDITILPVSFSYDRVMEERLFACELLGIPKPKESTKGLFKAYTRILNEKLGYVYVNFGDPISAKEYFGGEVDRSIHNYGPVEMQELTSDESGQTARLAHTIVRQQQKLTMITCFNLAATVINQYVSDSCAPLTLEKLVSEVEWLSPVMTALGAILTVKGDLTESVRECIKLHKSFVAVNPEGKIKLLLIPNGKYEGDEKKMRGHRLSNNTMDVAVPFLMLQFYSNPCAHFLVNLCFVSVIVLSKKTGKLFVGELFKQFQFLRSVFSNEFILKKETEEEDFAAAFGFAKNQKAVVQSESEVKTGENDKLGQFCVSYVKLYILSYSMIIDVLLMERANLVTNQTVSISYQRIVESFMMKNIQIHPASLSLNLVDNAIQAFVSMNAIKRIRRKHELFYEINHSQLRMIKNQLGNFEAVTKLRGRIWEHVDNFMYCKY